MADLNTDIRYIKGIGEMRAKALNKLGIFTLRELISYFPRAYEDRSKIYSIAELPIGESACTLAMVAADSVMRRLPGGKAIVRFRAVDETGALDVIIFTSPKYNLSYKAGTSYYIFGKVEGTERKRTMTNPSMEPEDTPFSAGRIMPIYPLTAGVSRLVLTKAVRQGLDACRDLMPEILPDQIRMEHKLCFTNYAYENIHFPTSPEILEIARRRMVFEELFVLTCGLSLLRCRRKDVTGPLCRNLSLDPFYKMLPFQLTGAQQRAVQDVISDMTSGKPMNRLCQGDVGSGKTMVAAACIWFAHQNNWQSALMAPTEILARQHYENLAPLFAKFGITCALLTGSTKAKERSEILKGLQNGSIHLCIGTHALLTSDVAYERLGLVITDEQHRFGVNQRAALSQKAENPHMLVLSATPIPRTLALIIYGDLDVSIINELPPGRQKVDTFAVGEAYRERMNQFIRKQVQDGHQVFVVCPLVGDAETIPDERKAVTAYAEKLQKEYFPDLRISVLHGKMKPKEKESVMSTFASGQSDILVSTTVVEVGVDVPNANLMIIENAERFGLSQLHQLRGRVGRGSAKSYCILVSDHDGEENKRRLKVLTQTNDGFVISEEDLKLRGPGDFFGSRQHGLPTLKIADFECDMRLLEEAQSAAKELLRHDPMLLNPEHILLNQRIHELFSLSADTLN